MNRARAIYSGLNAVSWEDAKGIRRHLQHLEQQVEQLRQTIDPSPVPPVATPAVGGAISCARVRAVISARRARDCHFNPELFADPAWDMLLELYASELAQHRIAVSKLCDAAAVPQTTALRWVTILEKENLVERIKDPLDARRIFIELTGKARAALEACFSAEVPPK